MRGSLRSAYGLRPNRKSREILAGGNEGGLNTY